MPTSSYNISGSISPNGSSSTFKSSTVTLSTTLKSGTTVSIKSYIEVTAIATAAGNVTIGPARLYLYQTAPLTTSSDMSYKVNTAGGTDSSKNWSQFRFTSSTSSFNPPLQNYTNVITWSSSTGSVADTYTQSTKTFEASLYASITGTYKVPITPETFSLNLTPITISISVKGTKKYSYTLSYYQNDDFGGDLISSSTYTQGSSVEVRSAYNRSLSSTDIPRYIYFDMQGWKPSQDKRDKSTSQTRKYIFLSWSGKQPNDTFTINSNTSLTEQYRIDYGDIVYKTVDSLPTVYKKGYVKTNTWYDQNNSVVDAQTIVSSDLTIHPVSEKQNYQIRFNLNGGQLDPELGKVTDYTIDKTYEINTQKTPLWIPTRLGYKFVGWSDQSRAITPIMNNTIIGDNFYDAINTEYTNNNVTLYAQWDYNVNTVECKYYLTDDGTIQTDTHTYNIDTSTLDSQGDKAFLKYAPSKLRSGDYVFLGWLDTMPDGWDNSSMVNKGYHGTYTVPPEKIVDSQGHEIKIELPIDIKIKNYKTLSDWGITERYYGIWAKTGKYIKIGNSWKKVNKCFVKIDGLWKTVTDIWTKQNRTWKHEI